MARIPDIERRLLNWARWLALLNAGGGGNYASVDLATERVDCAGWDAPSVIPTSEAEAVDTDKAVQALPTDLRVAVKANYIGTGSVAEKARKMGISLAGLYARVEMAHNALARHFNDLRIAADAERQRVEALQRSLAKA